MANNGIGILFQVAGGGSISGKSGQLIKSQLETLSSNIKLKINIDREHFSSQLGSLKAEIQKQLGTLNVNFHTNQGSSGGNGSGTSGANGENQAYQQLKATLNSLGSLRQKLASQVRSQSQEATELQAQVNEKYAEYTRLVEQNKGTLSTDQLNSLEQLKQKIDATAASQERLTAARRQDKLAGAETSYKGLFAQAQQLLTNNNSLIKSNKDAAETADNLRAAMGKPFPSDNYEEAVQYNQNLARTVKEASAKFGELAQKTDTIGQKFRETFKNKIVQTFAYALIGLAVRALRQVYTNVVEIDSAMTQLRIVTNASDAQMTKFLNNSIKLSKELGASIKDVLASVETFSRLGYGLEDATILSQYATILSKVANVTSDEATKGLTSILKGYGFDPSDTEHIADVLVEVGQKYAVSASELMEAYSKAGAALNATNTSFEKSAGLIAAANAAVQDSSVVGTALKTVSARIRKSKADLDELGESADDLAESWSMYADEIKALTGFDIMADDSKTKFKDLYDIFDGLAKVWNRLGDDAETTQARVAEILGGTRQYQVISSILTNWGDAAGAYTDAMDSAGASTRAMSIYVDSVEGRIGQLKASMEELSNSVLSSDLVKIVVNILNGGINAINWLAQVIDKVIGLNNALIILAATIGVIKYQAILTFLTKLIAPIKALIAWVQTFRLQMHLGAMDGESFGVRVSGAFQAATAAASTFQIVIGAVIIAITALVAVIHSVKRAQEEAIQASMSAAEQYTREAEEAKKAAESLDELIAKYKELADKNAGTWDDEAIKQVQSIQDDIVGLVGDQATGIDLVNGKLSDQYDILDQIAGKQKEISLAAAQSALADATVAAKDAMSKWRYNTYYDLGFSSYSQWGNPKKYGDIVVEQHTQSAMGAGTLYYDAIKYQFDSVEEFARQYEAVLAYKEQFAQTFNEHNTIDVMFYKELNEYLTEFKDVYDTYHSARTLVDDLTNPKPKNNGSNDENDVERNLLTLRSVAKILGEISGKYDALTDAMSDMDEYGVLTAKTFTSMIKDYPDLIKYLQQTENGYILNANALEEYVQGLIDAYTAEAALAAMTAENKEIAIQNLKNLQTALAMLAVSSNKVKSDSSARKKALQDEKDALKDQLDAYKELIDLRKKLLQQYEDELQYKRELEKKEKKVATLQTQYAISQLDTTAAGRAKTRQLAQDLAEAQEDLDDYTLEHAIDVVTNELDSQYEEYKRWIDGKIDDIEDKIDALGTSNTSDSNGVSAAIAAAAASAASKISDAIAQIEITPVVNGGGGGSGGGTTGGGRWTSYKDAANAGYSNIRTEHEFARGGSDKEKYGTYQAYLDAMYDKYVGDNPKSAAIAAAQSYVSSHGMLEGDKNRWGQDPNFLPLLRALIAAGGSIDDLHGKTNTVRGNTGVYHSGGIVGDFTNLRSTEMFAKLLKGEFVATPAMMETFMNHTLPAVAGIGGSNEFNAPLISIQCDNVTQESLPKLKDIIEEAVQEIKKQLDGGLSRAGYRKPAKKITI